MYTKRMKKDFIVNKINKYKIHKSPGTSCSKLTLLVNVSLKFQTLISEMHQYFLLKKYVKLLYCTSFQQKDFSIVGNKVVKHLTS